MTTTVHLLVLALIIDPLSAYECKKYDDFERSEQLRLKYFNELGMKVDTPQFEQYILSKETFTTVAVQPENNTKAAKLIWFPKKKEARANEIDYSFIFSNRDQELEGQYRVAPKIDEAYCLNIDDKENKFVAISGERFRGNLMQAVKKDGKFIDNMVETSKRFEFYRKMMQAFSEIAKLKLKHCNLKPENILYKEENADFDSDYENGEEELTYFPVVTDFDWTVPYNQNCKGGAKTFTDPEDYKNNLNHTAAFKACVEIFSMSLIILSVETGVLTQLGFRAQDQISELKAKLETLPPPTYLIKLYSGLDNAMTKNNIYNMYEDLTMIVAGWNTGTVKNFNHEDFRAEYEYVLSGVRMYQEYILGQSGMREEDKTQMLAVYDSFTTILIDMVRKNDMITKKQRLNPNEVISGLDKAFQKAKAIEESAARRRNRRNLVI